MLEYNLIGILTSSISLYYSLLKWVQLYFLPLRQGEEVAGDPGGHAAVGQEHEQPALVAGSHRDRAVAAHRLWHLWRQGDSEEAQPAAGKWALPLHPKLSAMGLMWCWTYGTYNAARSSRECKWKSLATYEKASQTRKAHTCFPVNEL